jgi:hypothetical protein
MELFGKKPAAKPTTQSQAFEKFKATIQTAIYDAQQHGVWAATLAQHLEAKRAKPQPIPSEPDVIASTPTISAAKSRVPLPICVGSIA